MHLQQSQMGVFKYPVKSDFSWMKCICLKGKTQVILPTDGDVGPVAPGDGQW